MFGPDCNLCMRDHSEERHRLQVQPMSIEFRRSKVSVVRKRYWIHWQNMSGYTNVRRKHRGILFEYAERKNENWEQKR